MRKKAVIFLFNDNNQFYWSMDYLLDLGVKFQYPISKRFIQVSQRNFKKHNLDLMLRFKSCASVL
jgi:hypothetical protein